MPPRARSPPFSPTSPPPRAGPRGGDVRHREDKTLDVERASEHHLETGPVPTPPRRVEVPTRVSCRVAASRYCAVAGRPGLLPGP